MNELELIERCRAGEAEARHQLFEQNVAGVYRLLLRMAGDAENASDLTQNTFVKGFQRLDQFSGRSAVATWFYRIAVNEALQFRRSGRTSAAKLRDLARVQPDVGQSPATDLRMDVESALSELDEDDKALLLLRYQEELDYRAIADVLACAEGTVASRLNRARERLGGVLRGNYGSYGMRTDRYTNRENAL